MDAMNSGTNTFGANLRRLFMPRPVSEGHQYYLESTATRFPPAVVECRAMSAGAHFPKQGSNPTRRGLMHLFALSVLVGHHGTPLEQQPDDAGLLVTRLR